MKTIEEKAKAYDEALKAAIAAHKDEDRHLKATLERIFPELQESEDERIRKGLIKALSSIGKRNWGGIDVFESISWLEKQGEHKLTDKIESKFHEGEWIISNDKKSTYQVIEVKRGIYVIRDNVDNHEYHIGIEECEKSGRLFTIQDAKDGDVLQLGVVTVIFQEYIGNGNCKCYYSVCNGEFEIPTKDESYGTFNATPATKEQRDLLFSKMRESGYEFDFEKKELKKLSQRMISAEAKEALYDKPTDEEMKELLRTEYEKGRADTIAEIEKDWSEEDEVKINRIVACLENLNVADNDILLKDVDWLKSLKDRVIPKPKHEWSIEDERTIAIINNALTESNTPPDDYDKVYDWLESLRKRIGG